MVSQPTEKFEVRSRWTNAVKFTAEIVCAPDAPLSIKLGLAVRWAVKNWVDLSDSDLSGSDLSGSNLSGSDLSGSNLSDSDLSGSDLSGSNLSGSNLSGSDLSGSNLSGSNLSGSDLSGSDLSGSNLSGSDLSDSDLSGSDLSGSNLSGSNLSGSDLSEEQFRPFKADLFLTLSSLVTGAQDAQHLIAKLRAGKVDGNTYGKSGTECACLVGTIAQTQGVSGESLDHNSSRPAERWFMMINPGDVPGTLGTDGKETGGGFAARKALEWALAWCAAHGVDAGETLIPAAD